MNRRETGPFFLLLFLFLFPSLLCLSICLREWRMGFVEGCAGRRIEVETCCSIFWGRTAKGLRDARMSGAGVAAASRGGCFVRCCSILFDCGSRAPGKKIVSEVEGQTLLCCCSCRRHGCGMCFLHVYTPFFVRTYLFHLPASLSQALLQIVFDQFAHELSVR